MIGVVGITVGNFNEVKEVTFERVVASTDFSVITVGGLGVDTRRTTCLVGCSDIRKAFRRGRVSCGSSGVIVSGIGFVGVFGRGSPTLLP